MDDERFITAQITITKYLDDNVDGGVAVQVDYSEDLPLIEAMGLLTFATLGIQTDYDAMNSPDDN